MRLFSEHSTQVMHCNTMQQMPVWAICCSHLPFPTSNSSPPGISTKFPLLHTAQNNFGLTQHPVKQMNFTRTCSTAPSVVSLTNYPALLSLETKKWKYLVSAETFRNWHSWRCFTSSSRGIGISFQLAITAPLYSIIGYCIATAQS